MSAPRDEKAVQMGSVYKASIQIPASRLFDFMSSASARAGSSLELRIENCNDD